MRVDEVVEIVDTKVDVKLVYDIDCFFTSLMGLYLYPDPKSYNRIRLESKQSR